MQDQNKTKAQLIAELNELRQAKQSAALSQVRLALAHELELPALFRTTVEVIANTFGYPLVSLFVRKQGKADLQHQVGYAADRISASRQISQRVIDTQKPLLLKDMPADEALSGPPEQLCSEVCVPLFDQGRVAGTLNVGSTGGATLGESDLHLLVTLGGYVDIAVERAHLYTEEREAEEKYRTLIEQSNDAIYLIHGNRFEIVNRKFEELFGVTQAEANAPDFVFTKIVAPKSRRQVLEQARKERVRKDKDAAKVSPVYEFTALDKDGNEIEVELTVSYPMYKGKLATQGVLRDITERKRTEAERAAMQAQMFQSAKLASVGELAAGVAHEINNPIFAIREYADLMLEDTPPDDPTYPMLDTIIKESNRIAEIVRNLLEFSRPGETSFSPVHLADVWQLVYNLIGQSFRKHNIQLEVDIPANLPPIQARTQQLQQVLLNLVTNARDALREKYPDGGSRPEKSVTVKARVVGDTRALARPNGDAPRRAIELTVRDEGIGILPEDREQLFLPFFTTKRARGGTGLGLSISHKIIEEHKGRIEVESEPGEFTEFKVTLPVVD